MAAAAPANGCARFHRSWRLPARQHDSASERAQGDRVLDWELCTIGDPMADFTYHLMQWQMPGEGSNTGTGLLDADLAALGIPSMDIYTSWYLARTRSEEQTS